MVKSIEELNYMKLNRLFESNRERIQQMINNNMNMISKDMFQRAYIFSSLPNEGDIEVLTQIISGDEVFYNDAYHEVQYADSQLHLAKLDDMQQVVNSDLLERTPTPPKLCMGRLLELDSTMTEFVLNNLEMVSRIGYEIYRVDIDEEMIFLGVPSVSSDAYVEYHTPLYFAWLRWNEKVFEKLKDEVKANEF